MPRGRNTRKPSMEQPPTVPRPEEFGDPMSAYAAQLKFTADLAAWEDRTGMKMWLAHGRVSSAGWEDGDVISRDEHDRRCASFRSGS
jgi:hypothetical protein